MVWLALALLPLAIPRPAHEGHRHHYEYVFPDSSIYVYDTDHRGALLKHVSVPTAAGVRGAVASAVTGMLYISYGSDHGSGGSLLKYNLMADEVVWAKRYSFGVDSMSISPDGNTIYMPTGELAPGGVWKVIDANSGNVSASINSGGTGPHNTIVSPDGARVYLGPRYTNYLVVASTRTHQVIRKIGPVGGVGGVRPFTVNGAQSLVFITLSRFLGFQVGDISTGKILYTVPVRGFPTTGRAVSAPSHGISLSPDEKEIYLMDSINSYVHVFDVTGLPGSAPRQVADIPLVRTVSGRERPCAYDCLKDGWLHHSRDGRYVFVGDSGDVIDTTLRKTAMTLPALANTRKAIEIDFEDGAALPTWAMNNRSSIGGNAPEVHSAPFRGASDSIPVAAARLQHFNTETGRLKVCWSCSKAGRWEGYSQGSGARQATKIACLNKADPPMLTVGQNLAASTGTFTHVADERGEAAVKPQERVLKGELNAVHVPVVVVVLLNRDSAHG